MENTADADYRCVPAPTTPTSGTSTTASLSWSAPTNSTGVAGYNVYVGTAPGLYGPPTNVGNVTSYVVNNLVIGNTYYFAVTDYNSSGVESPPSNEVYKVVY
ncbi:MAG TPA: fibronectin type III domain-containing protein [Nitrospira sp.]|nr:fibronectin type III domain-containing protein [Nitrospira sp.]